MELIRIDHMLMQQNTADIKTVDNKPTDEITTSKMEQDSPPSTIVSLSPEGLSNLMTENLESKLYALDVMGEVKMETLDELLAMPFEEMIDTLYRNDVKPEYRHLTYGEGGNPIYMTQENPNRLEAIGTAISRQAGNMIDSDKILTVAIDEFKQHVEQNLPNINSDSYDFIYEDDKVVVVGNSIKPANDEELVVIQEMIDDQYAINDKEGLVSAIESFNKELQHQVNNQLYVRDARRPGDGHPTSITNERLTQDISYSHRGKVGQAGIYNELLLESATSQRRL